MNISLLILPLLFADSPIKSDEEVLFIPTAAHLDKGEWVVPVHGWIYEPERGDLLRRKALEELSDSLGLKDGSVESKRFRERAAAFLYDNERGKEISVRIGEKVVQLGESKPNGHFHGTIRLSAGEAKQLAEDGWVAFRAITREGDRRTFEGRALLLQPAGLSVVCDIDDTLKVSNVRDKVALLENTFLEEYQAVPGMAEVLDAWRKKGAAFHYVSASPWQLYGPLNEFFARQKYPPGTWHMKLFRVKDSSFANLFQSPLEYKLETIEPLLKAHPKRKFVLIGDSGEKDPEAYGELARRYPEQVEQIVIRELGEEIDQARYRKAFAEVPEAKWMIKARKEEQR
jgi:hypothetical protein